jgi:hypothetical protein
MDAMSGSPSPCSVFARTPVHATERAESERVSVVVRVIDMVLIFTALDAPGDDGTCGT